MNFCRAERRVCFSDGIAVPVAADAGGASAVSAPVVAVADAAELLRASCGTARRTGIARSGPLTVWKTG
jgi:hypothetical protein